MDRKEAAAIITIASIILAGVSYYYGFTAGKAYGKILSQEFTTDVLNCYDWSCVFQNLKNNTALATSQCVQDFVKKYDEGYYD